jgi:hypothetical protein
MSSCSHCRQQVVSCLYVCGSRFAAGQVFACARCLKCHVECVPWRCLLSMPFCVPGCCRCCCSVKRLSVEQLVAEDVALDKSCTDALSYVRTYEQLRGYHKQLQPNMVSTLCCVLLVSAQQHPAPARSDDSVC